VTCKTCDELLGDYRRVVNLFKDAVRQGSGAIGADVRRAGEEVERLRVRVHDADTALMAHFRQHRKDFSQKAPSS
jgi:hypothetical protein